MESKAQGKDPDLLTRAEREELKASIMHVIYPGIPKTNFMITEGDLDLHLLNLINQGLRTYISEPELMDSAFQGLTKHPKSSWTRWLPTSPLRVRPAPLFWLMEGTIPANMRKV